MATIHDETWFCPNCGQPATAKVGILRLVECRPCKWVFDVRLYGYIDRIEDDKAILRERLAVPEPPIPEGRSTVMIDDYAKRRPTA